MSVKTLILPSLTLPIICLYLSLLKKDKNPNLINKSAHLSNLNPFSEKFGYKSKISLIDLFFKNTSSKNAFKLIICIYLVVYTDYNNLYLDILFIIINHFFIKFSVYFIINKMFICDNKI